MLGVDELNEKLERLEKAGNDLALSPRQTRPGSPMGTIVA